MHHKGLPRVQVSGGAMQEIGVVAPTLRWLKLQCAGNMHSITAIFRLSSHLGIRKMYSGKGEAGIESQ